LPKEIDMSDSVHSPGRGGQPGRQGYHIEKWGLLSLPRPFGAFLLLTRKYRFLYIFTGVQINHTMPHRTIKCSPYRAAMLHAPYRLRVCKPEPEEILRKKDNKEKIMQKQIGLQFAYLLLSLLVCCFAATPGASGSDVQERIPPVLFELIFHGRSRLCQ